LEEGWASLRFGRVQLETRGAFHYFTAEVDLGSLSPRAVRLQLYAEGTPTGSARCHDMTRMDAPPDHTGTTLYTANVPADRPSEDYTARIVPYHPGAGVPLEAAFIHWQK